MKVLVTGTHFTPAIATIEELKKYKGAEIFYVGRKTTLEGDNSPSVESKVLSLLGIKFIPITTGRLQRSLTLYTIPSLLKIPLGFLQSLFIIFKEKPDIIFSFGGYVALPVVLVGWFFSIPIIIHEQGLTAGLANKISSVFADKIAVSFSGSGFKGDKVILTGNPVRSDVVRIPGDGKLLPPGRGLPTVLVMGGNQGSHVINLAVEQNLEKLLKVVKVIHQTGDSKFKDFERLGKSALSSKGGYEVRKWIGKEYGKTLRECDLVVCRSGINTLCELAFLGKPAILIPIPNKEQKKNAKYFEHLRLAKVLMQEKLTGETLLKEITYMVKNLKTFRENAKLAKNILLPDASKRLALEAVLLFKKQPRE